MRTLVYIKCAYLPFLTYNLICTLRQAQRTIIEGAKKMYTELVEVYIL